LLPSGTPTPRAANPSGAPADWAIGFVTGHRVRVVAIFLAGITALTFLQHLFWPYLVAPSTGLGAVWSWGSLLWLGPLVAALLGMVGLLAYRHPTRLGAVRPINKLVSWRVVSRGTNIEALSQTIRRCRAEMNRSPMFPYIIEVVIDENPIDRLPQGDDIRYIVVPADYRTPSGSLFKARALHYACEHSPLSPEAWIVHLDEETHPTPSAIRGIAAAIREEDASGALRIGQGAIVYHRKWEEHPFLTLADTIRTGDDFGRFYLERRMGRTIFGLHGSFIVVRNDVECAIGFDFGPPGSITEDAFWALVAMERGYRTRWVEGYLEEQSTQSAMDFVKQRGRWFRGLIEVVLHAPAGLRWRAPLGVKTTLWALTPFVMLYTIANLFAGVSPPDWIWLMANASLAAFNTFYLIGLKANMDEHGINGFANRAKLYALQVGLLPVFGAMESFAVLRAIVRPSKGFYVVKK
jgi:egghead protein (zeste-white 4 protein)